MSDIYFYTSKGKKLAYKRGDFSPSDVVTSPVVERIRIRQSLSGGLDSARVTNPAASNFRTSKRGASLGMGGPQTRA